MQQRVRDKLGVHEAYLPDAVIAQPDFLGLAEAMIEKITNKEGKWKDAAIVCQCAALLCPTMDARLPKAEKDSFFQRESSIDWEKRRKELEEERDMALSHIIEIEHFRGFTIT